MAKQPKPLTIEEQAAARTEELRKRTDEAQRLMDEAVPTPTQAETDLSVMSIAAGQGAIEPAPSGEPEEPGVNVPPAATPATPASPPAPASGPKAATSDTGGAAYKNRADKSA